MDWLIGRSRPAAVTPPPVPPPAIPPQGVSAARLASKEVHDAAAKVKPKGSGQWRDVRRALEEMNLAINRYEEDRDQ